MPQDVAELYASNMMSLATQARGVIRDLNPKVCVIECFLFACQECSSLYVIHMMFFLI